MNHSRPYTPPPLNLFPETSAPPITAPTGHTGSKWRSFCQPRGPALLRLIHLNESGLTLFSALLRLSGLAATSSLLCWKCLGGAHLQVQALAILSDRVADIISGTVFLFIGFLACGIAAMRRRSGAHILIWLGLWNAMYGFRTPASPLAAMGLLPNWFQSSLPFLDTVAEYLTLVVGSRAFIELTIGKMRLFLRAVISVALAIALAGIGFFIFTGSNDKLMLYNNLLAARPRRIGPLMRLTSLQNPVRRAFPGSVV
jgi:hypothetical protein